MASPSHQSPLNNKQNTRTQSPSEVILREMRSTIFKAAMRREWNNVHDLYKKDRVVRCEKITRADDTVLHVAISGAQQPKILELLKVIVEDNSEEERQEILYAKNNKGDTPLHLAAELGLEKVCYKIARLEPKMVTTARNKLQETPLFTAVRHGKKNAFFVLEAARKIALRDSTQTDEERDFSHCRGDDGNTILHHAIKGEQFDIAHEIIKLYPVLVHYVNTSGESALHILANKPSVFKSGTRLGICDGILYFSSSLTTGRSKGCGGPDEENQSSSLRSGICKCCHPTDEENQTIPSRKVVKSSSSSLGTPFAADKEGSSAVFSANLISDFAETSETSSGDAPKVKPKPQPATLRHENLEADKTNHDAGAQNEDEYKTSQDKKQRRYVLGIGLTRLEKIKKLKQQHEDAVTIMKELVSGSKLWEYEDASGGKKPSEPTLVSQMEHPQVTIEPTSEDLGSNLMIAAKMRGRDMLKELLEKLSLEVKNADKKDIITIGLEEKESTNGPDTASPLLVAAKMGIKEMVQNILKMFPVAIHDQDKDGKNIVLLAAEHRQVHVYKFLLIDLDMKENVLRKADNKGNSALHHAAMLSDIHRPWSIPGAALQMHWEMKWYKYVLGTMKQEMFSRTNNEGKTAHEKFTESHETLIKDARKWLTDTSQSCSVVAALVATVAFASASTVPGGVDTNSGSPVLVKRPAFQLFAIASLIALCFSVTSLAMFLAILTSRYQVWDFKRRLPVMLILGLTCLFMSIASMLVSFCAGDFFVVDKSLKFATYPIYVVMCFPVTIFAFAQFPLYFDLMEATLKKVPERIEKMQDY